MSIENWAKLASKLKQTIKKEDKVKLEFFCFVKTHINEKKNINLLPYKQYVFLVNL